MSRERNISWVKSNLSPEEIRGVRVLDVGSHAYLDEPVITPYIESSTPLCLVGTDINPGPTVSVVCDIYNLTSLFALEAFDIVLCLEVLEHVEDWKVAVKNLKAMVRPGGLLIVTTRLPNYPEHGYPKDFWRFERADFEKIFSDFTIERIEEDREDDGIYGRFRKPLANVENLQLFSIKLRGRPQ